MSRVAVTSLGPAEKLGAAQIPIRARGAADYASRGMINGSPGTMPIAAPRPGGVPQDSTGLAIDGGDSRSSDAPPVWYPGVYYENNTASPPEHAPVSILSDNQMPMPAVNPLGPPAVLQGRPRMGGQFSIPNRAASPAFPPLGGRSG
jgi:hypothetical protein